MVKNRDHLAASVTSLLRDSKVPLVTELFTTGTTETGGLVPHESASRKQTRQQNAHEVSGEGCSLGRGVAALRCGPVRLSCG